ncbi:MAG: hypothetical protein ACRDNS_18515 [Trebonia sp.]
MSSDETHASSDPLDLGSLGGAWQPAPVCWKHLDRATARREWAALAEWARWLVGRYALTPRTVPPCWYRHGTLVEELSALRTGWLAAFAPDAPGSGSLDWHTMFAATRTRLDDAVNRVGCTKDDHRDDQIPRWLSADAPEYEKAVTNDLDARSNTPPPPPWN